MPLELKIASTTADVDAMNVVLNTPDVYAGLSNEDMPPCGQADIRLFLGTPESFAVTVSDDGVTGGFFFFKPLGQAIYEVHTALLLRGKQAIEAGRAVIRFVFDQCNVTALISLVPICQRHVMVFALKCGFTKIGRTDKWKKHGRDYPMHIVELSRELYLRGI